MTQTQFSAPRLRAVGCGQLWQPSGAVPGAASMAPVRAEHSSPGRVASACGRSLPPAGRGRGGGCGDPQTLFSGWELPLFVPRINTALVHQKKKKKFNMLANSTERACSRFFWGVQG